MNDRWTILVAGLLVCACMDPLKDYDACVEIETARCEKRHSCRDNEVFQNRFDDFDQETCLAYIEEHCRTREIQGKEWDNSDVRECARAIREDVACEDLDPGIDETEKYLEESCGFIEAEEEEEETDTSTDSQSVADDTDTIADDTDTAADTTGDSRGTDTATF